MRYRAMHDRNTGTWVIKGPGIDNDDGTVAGYKSEDSAVQMLQLVERVWVAGHEAAQDQMRKALGIKS